MSDKMTDRETVTVACKLPHGLLLQLQECVEAPMPAMGGGLALTKVWHYTGEAIAVAGNAHPQNMAPTVQLAGGFALTHNVPKKFWDAWVEQNKTLPAVVKGLIFARGTAERASAEATEKKELRTGLERIDPNNLPKEFSKRVETADEIKKRIAA